MNTWQGYRRNVLTPNGWRASRSPGVYVHQETGNEYHPWEYRNGKQQWQWDAERGVAPDPHKTHIERRRWEMVRQAHRKVQRA